MDNTDAALVAKLLYVLDCPGLVEEVLNAYRERSAPEERADERGALEARRDARRSTTSPPPSPPPTTRW